jgi:hypothetical protein
MDSQKKDKITVSEAINLDIIFLIDTRGSMSNELDAVKKSCTDFADTIIRENKKVRLGLIGFDIGGYRGDVSKSNYKVQQLSYYTIGIWDLASPYVFKDNIKTLSLGLFGGGGCYLADNNSVDIFTHVVTAFDDNHHSKILVIISDEMGRCEGVDSIVGQLNSANIETYVMGVPKSDGPHEAIAKRTGGKFWNIFDNRGQQDFSVLLKNVANEIIGSIAQKAKDAGFTDEFLASYSSGKSSLENEEEILIDSNAITSKWETGNGNDTQTSAKQAADIGSKWLR